MTTANYESLKLSVNLVEEEDGIIRAHGRVQQKKLPVEMRKPVMLERNHKVTELILRDCHRRVKHNGVRETLSGIPIEVLGYEM